MSLFVVLWMMNSGDRVKSSVTGYFRDPRAYTHKLGAGPANSGEGLQVHRENVADNRRQLEQALRAAPEFDRIKDNVKFSITGEGTTHRPSGNRAGNVLRQRRCRAYARR